MHGLHRPRAGLALVAALLAVTAVAVGIALRDASRLRADTGVQYRRQAILTAARQEAIDFTTLDYRSLDHDLGQVADGATGTFRAQFLAQAAQLRSLLQANRAVSTGQVLEAGLVSDSPTAARVLVVVDGRVTNLATPGGTLRHYRLLLDLQQVSGRWRTVQLQFVG